MRLGFLIIFKIIDAHANSFVLERIRIRHRASSGPHKHTYIPDFGVNNFQAFQSDFLADCLCVVHAFRLSEIYISHAVTWLHSLVERNFRKFKL